MVRSFLNRDRQTEKENTIRIVFYAIITYVVVALILLVGGPVMADDTGLLSPTANDGVFLSAVEAYHDDNQDAKAQDHGDQHIYYNYHINMPPGSTIDGIKVILDACRKPGNEGYLKVELSWDGGLLSWTGSKTTDSFPQQPTYETKSLGDSTDTWGRSWTVSEVSDSNFRVRITALFGNPTKQGWIKLDWCPVRIYYTPPPVAPPTVTNSTGASSVTTTAARLNGEVSSTGGENPTVHIYWGDNEGGTIPGNWDHNEDLGTKGAGTFYKDISNLSPNTTYYYRCYATNSGGSDWADSSASFTTSSPPTGSITINNGAQFTSFRNVTLTLSATNASQMCFSNDKSSWSSWENYATAKSWTLTSGDGLKRVYVKFRDNAGNVSETYSDTIVLDTTPPTGSISINNDATYTGSRSVTLTLSASDRPSSGIAEMMISNSSSFEGASWEDYTTSKSWTLASGDGEKKVYVKFKDGAGNISEICSDDIILDTTPPTVTITSPSADTSVRSEVVIKGTASDENFLEYKVEYGQGTEPSSWTEITSSTSQVTDDTLASWDTSSLNDGSYTLRLTAADLASNSAQTQVSLRVDNHPPEVTLIDYPSDTVTGNTPKVDVTFTWEGSDPDGITPAEDLVYQQKLVGHPDYSEWSDWSSETTKTYMLSSGNYTLKVRAKDEAGNYPEEDDPATAKSSFTVSLPIIIYPNPCYPNQGQIIRIANLPLTSDVKIYIYDLGGNLVRTLGESETSIERGSKTATWDCRNDNGEVVARGIYIYFIPSATEKKTGKIAVIK